MFLGVFGSGQLFSQQYGQNAGGGPLAEYSSLSFSGGTAPPGSYGAGGMRPGTAHPATTETTDDDPGGDGARAIKRARLVWTPQLHKRFEEAVLKLGHEKSIPKNIMAVRIQGLVVLID